MYSSQLVRFLGCFQFFNVLDNLAVNFLFMPIGFIARYIELGQRHASFEFFFFFVVLSFELLVRQVFYHLNHSASPVLCWVFLR
jgi:hypothetical protein